MTIKTSSKVGQDARTVADSKGGQGKLPFPAVFGWGLGSVGTLVLLNITNSLVLKYLVDIVGVAAAIAGTIIAATRIFDAFLDPFMGSFSDATVSRWGRRRPFLLAGGVMCAAAPILIFAAPSALTGSSAVAYMVVALLFYALAYTTFNVPYMAMPVEMTQSHHERTYLFSFRIYATAIAGVIGGAMAPSLVEYFGGGREGFAMMAYIMSAVILTACFTSFYLTRNAPVSDAPIADKNPKFTQIRYALRNKPFLSLMIAKIFLVSGTGIGGAAMAFFVTIVLEKPLSWLGFFVIGATIGMMGSQVLWLKIARALGKRKCFLIAAAFYIVVVLTWLLAGPEETQIAVAVRAFALGVFGGGLLLTSQAMLPDTLQHELELTGVQHEGVLTGIYTTVERGASALGVAIAGFVLGAGGYIGGLDPAQQSASAISAIYLCMAVLPAVAVLLSSAAIWKYDLPG